MGMTGRTKVFLGGANRLPSMFNCIKRCHNSR